VYKENRDDWHKANILISTIQTFLAKNRYKRLFAPDDFDLVISDEARTSSCSIYCAAQDAARK
jgi:type I restriction enzyme R subunit